MIKLTREFVPAVDEVWHLQNLQAPEAELYRKAGGGMQGVYALTPEGQMLAFHHGRHDLTATTGLMNAALKKWAEIVAQKNLKPKPVPPRNPVRTWGPEGVVASAGGDVGAKAGLILQVNSRDLPRGAERYPGRNEFEKGCWNQDWFDCTADEALGFLPKQGAKAAVPDALVRKLLGPHLIDNVRGQNDEVWQGAEIRKAVLTAESVSSSGDQVTVRLLGEFHADSGRQAVHMRLAGQATFHSRAGRFLFFELAAVGVRRGAAGFTFRTDDAPTPLGVSFIIEDQYERARPAAAAKGLGLGSKPDPKTEEK